MTEARRRMLIRKLERRAAIARRQAEKTGDPDARQTAEALDRAAVSARHARELIRWYRSSARS